MPVPAPAIPPFEPPPTPSSLDDSGRRILWIIGLYRAVCGAALLGIALFVDLKTVATIAPNPFITGAALYFGSLLLAWWLVAAASGPDYFAFVNGIFGSALGRLVLLGYTFALILHALGGIRHFIWDTGRGYDLGTIDKMCWGSLFVAIVLTLALWALSGQLTVLFAKVASFISLIVT